MSLAHCSIASQDAGEPLAGTAVESVDRWLLLEVNDSWAPKPLQTEAVPSEVRARLARWLEEVPRSRLQLVRRPGRAGKRTLFMVASADKDRPGVSRLELDSYEDLMEVELDRLLGRTAPVDASLCLVCVHGRRDRCCAQHGSALFRALQGRGLDVWQTSHLGGHRFAACALWLPDGLMYGRLRPEHAGDFASAHARGELGDLDLFRGRCAHDRPTQAAEIFLHRRLGEQANDAITWISTTATGDSTWEAVFDSPTGQQHVRVRLEETGTARPASCGGDPEPVTRFVEI